jgi:hypothetical protein
VVRNRPEPGNVPVAVSRGEGRLHQKSHIRLTLSRHRLGHHLEVKETFCSGMRRNQPYALSTGQALASGGLAEARRGHFLPSHFTAVILLAKVAIDQCMSNSRHD